MFLIKYKSWAKQKIAMASSVSYGVNKKGMKCPQGKISSEILGPILLTLHRTEFRKGLER